MVAITHIPSPKMDKCQLTYVSRAKINYKRALAQHERYRRMLADCGADVIALDVNRDLPDCCFVEDTAIVLDELAIMMSMGAPSRRAEVPGIEAELQKHRPIKRIELPARIDGGDVVQVGRTLLVGLSSRTDAVGAMALEMAVRPMGYQVTTVPVHGCLHLKSACTALPDGRLLVNGEWIETNVLTGFSLTDVPAQEPAAADVLTIGQTVCIPASFNRTAEVVADLMFDVKTIDLSEFAKAEGGVTCLSLLLREFPARAA